LNTKELGALFGLAAIWGASFLFIRIASPVLGPFLTMQGRVTIAGIALLIYLWFVRQTVDFKRLWKQYLIIGALNAAIPFSLIATAALHLEASMSAILNSLTPLFTALVGWGWMKERLTVRKWIAMLMGIMGVVVLVGWSHLPLTKEVIAAVVFSVLSTISYAFAGVYAKTACSGVSPLSMAIGQQMGATVLMLPLAALDLPIPASSLSLVVIFSVLGLALLCTAVGYLLYFYLISSAGPTKAASVTFLIPLFGMIWGVVFLHESVTPGMLYGLMMILSSIFLLSDLSLQSLRKKQNRTKSA
jgi:drug/metabolite transporter (DMT)-like permease